MPSLTSATPHPPSQQAPTRGARSRMIGLVAGAAITLMIAAGCQVPVDQWVPDGNGDGKISQAEIDHQTKIVADALVQAQAEQRREAQLHPFLTCVRAHESDRGPYPHTGGYGAQNPYSSASGAYQFIDSTWRTVSARAGHPGYAKAKHAPAWVQDAVALHTVNNGGRSAWAGTGC